MGLVRSIVDKIFISDEHTEFAFSSYLASERGKWLKENSYQLTYEIITDPSTFGYKLVVFADLTEQDLTFYNLKWK